MAGLNVECLAIEHVFFSIAMLDYHEVKFQ